MGKPKRMDQIIHILKTYQQTDSIKGTARRCGVSKNTVRGDIKPSINVVVKLADALGVSVDYLLGKERFASYDKETVKRLQDLQELDPDTRSTLFSIIDTFVRDALTRSSYATN